MAFMKDILTHNIPIWEECAATPFVQEVQTGKLPLEKFKRYMIQDSIYLKNYARIYGKAIFHADTLREIQLYCSITSRNFVFGKFLPIILLFSSNKSKVSHAFTSSGGKA